MSTLAFSAGMAAPLVYLSFSFYDRYGFSKKLCNAFCAASCIAAALTALLSIVLKLSVEFAVLSCHSSACLLFHRAGVLPKQKGTNLFGECCLCTDKPHRSHFHCRVAAVHRLFQAEIV